MNDLYIWAGIAAAVIVLAWLLWPQKTMTEALQEVKAEEKAATPVAAVNDQITDAVTQTAPVKKPRAKKPTTPKVASKKAPAKKAAPKKAVKKGRK